MGKRLEQYRTVSGKGFDRLNAFSDGVFAIAITILALNLNIPQLSGPDAPGLLRALGNDWPQYFGFFLSFVIIGRYWILHHDLFSMMRAYDAKILWLNLLFLMTIVFLPFPTHLVSEYYDSGVAFAFYYGSIAAVGIAEFALYRYIVRHPKLHYADHEWTSANHGRVALLIPLAFVVAAVISVFSADLGQWAWVLVFLAKARR